MKILQDSTYKGKNNKGVLDGEKHGNQWISLWL